MKKTLIIATVCSLALMCNADTFQQSQVVTSQELREATANLAKLQATIADEKLPMSKQLESVENEVIALRSEAAEKRGLADSSDSSLITLQNQVDSLSDNINYMKNLLADYTVRFETLTALAERPTITQMTKAANDASENDSLSSAKRLDAQLKVISASFAHLQNIIGGYSFSGTASADGGNEIDGKYVLIGPASYFVPSDETMEAGITSEAANSIKPKLNTFGDQKVSDSIRQLAATNSSESTVYGPPQALLVKGQNQTVVEEWIKGGMVMPFILGLALAALIVAIFKFIKLMGVRAAKESDVDTILEFISQGKVDEARGFAAKIGGPVGDMLTAAVDNAYEDREVIEEVLYEKIISSQPKLERLLPFIAVVAATAPLLGLLGTVTGMIKTFKLITIVGTGDARALSSGISEALITTKWGLVSAIPAVIIHALLSRKARGVVGSMEQTAVSFINGVVEMREANNTQSA